MLTSRSIRPRHTVRVTIVALAALQLCACESLENLFGTASRDSGRAMPLGERPVVDAIHPNRFLIEWPDQTVVGEPQVVFTREHDTLPDFAREYGLGYDELVTANPDVNPWLPGDNTAILLPTQYVIPNGPREGIVLNIASKRLFYFPSDTIVRDETTGEIVSQVVLTFPIGIGRVGWETPLGDTKVVSKAKDPSWWVPASVRREHAELGDPLPNVVPPGPENPLGSRVLKLEMPGYLIHGTNQPYGVGMRVSHGCVRLYPENIEFLYELVGVGEPVTIMNEPFLLGHRDGEWFFEAHAPLEDDQIASDERLDALLERKRDVINTPMADHVRAIASNANGFPIRIAQYDEAEVFSRLRRVENTIVENPDAPTLEEVRDMIDEAVAEARAEEVELKEAETTDN